MKNLLEHDLESRINDGIMRIDVSQLFYAIALYGTYPLFHKYDHKVTGKTVFELKNKPKYKRLLEYIHVRTTGLYPDCDDLIGEFLDHAIATRFPFCHASLAGDKRFRDENDSYFVNEIWQLDDAEIEKEEKWMLRCKDGSALNKRTKALLKECIADLYEILMEKYGLRTVVEKYKLEPKQIK